MFRSRQRKLAGESLEARKFLHGGGLGMMGMMAGLGGLGGRMTIDEQVEATFERYDKNNDGTLNPEDSLSTRVTNRYAEADANDDGGVTSIELTQYWEASAVSKLLGISGSSRGFVFCGDDAIADRVESVLEMVDEDADGLVQSTEVASSLWEDLSSADTSGDGGLSPEELTAFAEGVQAEAQAEFVADAVDVLMSRLDGDDDGSIASTEVSERRWPRMADADTDESGAISQAELTAYVTEQVTNGEIGSSLLGFGGHRGFGGGPKMMGMMGRR